MSTSPNAARNLASASLPAASPSLQILPFPYDEVISGAGGPGFSTNEEVAAPHTGSAPDPTALAREAQLREAGRQQGQAEARRNFDEQLVRERAALAAAVAEFARDRALYYQNIETEVVQLALSMARRILHREAQVDPLLLAGIVRVALEKIEGATGVRLRVHPQNAAGWRSYLAAHMDPGGLPAVEEDASLNLERCVLQTSMGSTELGMEIQLKEIENGLMDLLAARPMERP
jgi:flagellar assembly protein FliH